MDENPVTTGIEVALRVATLLKDLLAAPLSFTKDIAMAAINHELHKHENAAKVSLEQRYNKHGYEPNYIKPSVISESQLKRLVKNGEEFTMVTVPTKQLESISDAVVKMGGALFIGETNNNISGVAVPKQYTEIFNNALKMQAALGEKSGDIIQKSVSKDDINKLNSLMRVYDIPVIPFFNPKKDCYINTLGKEFEERYNAVVDEYRELKEDLGSVQIEKFDKAEKFSDINFGMIKMSISDANLLNTKIQGIKYYESEKNEVIAQIPNEKLIEAKNYVESIGSEDNSKNYQIAVKDTDITLNLDTLGKVDETDLNLKVAEGKRDYYIMRVPKTARNGYSGDFIKIPKDAVKSNDGVTLTVQIKPDTSFVGYSVNVKNGKFSLWESGRVYNADNIYNNFDKPETFKDADTIIDLCQDNDNDVIEFFDKETKTLINVPVSDAKTMYDNLITAGLSSKTADGLITHLHDSTLENEKYVSYQEQMNYDKYISLRNQPKPEFTIDRNVDADKIAVLYRQALVADALKGAERVGTVDIESDKACGVIIDRENNQYVVLKEGDDAVKVKSQLSEMKQFAGEDIIKNCSKAAIVTEQVLGRYESVLRVDNTKSVEQSITLQKFEGCENIAIANQFSYNVSEDKTIAIARIDSDGNLFVNQITSDMDRYAIEEIISKDFGIENPTTAAEVSKGIMHSMDKKGLIEAASAMPIGNDYYLREITSKFYSVELHKEGEVQKSIIVDKNKLSTQHLVQALGMDNKQATSALKTIKVSEKIAQRMGKSYAERLAAAKTMSDNIKGKNVERATDFVKNFNDALNDTKVGALGGR